MSCSIKTLHGHEGPSQNGRSSRFSMFSIISKLLETYSGFFCCLFFLNQRVILRIAHLILENGVCFSVKKKQFLSCRPSLVIDKSLYQELLNLPPPAVRDPILQQPHIWPPGTPEENSIDPTQVCSFLFPSVIKVLCVCVIDLLGVWAFKCNIFEFNRDTPCVHSIQNTSLK